MQHAGVQVRLLGSFDLLNVGHLVAIDRAVEAAGDGTVVAYVLDPPFLSGHPPIAAAVDRARLIAAIRGVDAAVICDDPAGATADTVAGEPACLVWATDEVDPDALGIGLDGQIATRGISRSGLLEAS